MIREQTVYTSCFHRVSIENRIGQEGEGYGLPHVHYFHFGVGSRVEAEEAVFRYG